MFLLFFVIRKLTPYVLLWWFVGSEEDAKPDANSIVFLDLDLPLVGQLANVQAEW